MVRKSYFLGWVVICFLAGSPAAAESIRLANNPSLSPDGKLLAFDWAGDIWVVSSTGGEARALTQHPGKDTQPRFSPDGQEIAFISDRDGTSQVYVVAANGGLPHRLTNHTGGYTLMGWTPDGSQLLVRALRDHYWRHAERFFLIPRRGPVVEQLLFDDYGDHGSLSPDGRKLLFTREGTQWWRKGYHGSQAGQVWLYDLDGKKFSKVCAPDRGALYPLWKPDGSGCYVCSAADGHFNIHECNIATHTEKQLTHFADDSVVQPCLSKNGQVMVFRHLFDLYRFEPDRSTPPVKLDIRASGDRFADPTERRVLNTASQTAFSSDGLDIAFIAGGDLWVMDTELKEPKRVTATAEEERDPVFAPDGQAIYFVSDMHGECNLWRAERAEKSKFWWQNSEFRLTRLTQDKAAKSKPRPSPVGGKLAYLRDRGDLWVSDLDGKNPRLIVRSFTPLEFDWSPDGKWLVYAADDNDFNRDVWLVPTDGSKPPFNLSRTPFNEHFPTWSPDGRCIAWTGRRGGEENNDVHYVFLRAEDDQTTSRDKTLQKALEKMQQRRAPVITDGEVGGEQNTPTTISPASSAAGSAAPAAVTIDFPGIHDRIRTVSIPDSNESDLFWSPDGKRLAFTATVEGRRGTYYVELREDRAKLLNSAVGNGARWSKPNLVTWTVGGVPSSFTVRSSAAAPSNTPAPAAPPAGGRRGGARSPGPATTIGPASAAVEVGASNEYRFQALQTIDRRQRHAAVFDACWRTMRDQYYDDRLGNRDWDAVRQKYLPIAAEALDQDTLATVINLMLGELNGSHLGFFPGNTFATRRNDPTPEPTEGTRWREITAHVGVRFDPTWAGPGLRVRDVLPGGPAQLKKSELLPNDVITAVDGRPVNPNDDLTTAFNGPANREMILKVKNAAGAERTVAIRPITHPEARRLLYRKWIDDNAAQTDKLSGGKLGYLHIDAMAMPSFWKFQAQLYAVGHGKDGLVIDVRENGGGSTADHLLTALCQPEHAIAVPRGGGPGYPQDRKVYACWNKPVVVLCNQNSFSNAEIFSHAIKTLKRGQLVGVPTAGGVISTGGTQIMDAGFLRLPFRGWYLKDDGRDMELNGAVPHHVLWPQPGEMPAGKDVQLEKAVTVLMGDVTAFKNRPVVKLKKASESEPAGKNGRPVVIDRGGE